ncbi:hypothetical protein ABFS82_07G063100 [Erythranthe guttata]
MAAKHCSSLSLMINIFLLLFIVFPCFFHEVISDQSKGRRRILLAHYNYSRTKQMMAVLHHQNETTSTHRFKKKKQPRTTRRASPGGGGGGGTRLSDDRQFRGDFHEVPSGPNPESN